MKNYQSVSEENHQFINDIIKESMLNDYVKTEIVVDNTLPAVAEIKKSNPLMKHISNGIDIVLIINEIAFDSIPEEDMKIDIIKEAIHPISINIDNGAISIESPDITTYSSYLQTRDIQGYVRQIETVKSILSALKEQDSNKAPVGRPKKINKP